MSRPRPLIAALATALLIAAGCGDDDSGAPEGTGPPSVEESTEADPGGVDEPGHGIEPGDGVAAAVGDAEIAADTVDDLVDALLSAPQVAEQLADQDDDQLRTMLRAEVLTQLVVQEVILQGAEEDYGIEVSDEEVDAALDDLVDSVGGDEALDAQLETAGLTRGSLATLELPLTVALRHLQAEFGVDAPSAESPDAAADLTEEEVALQAWGAEKLQTARVAVASAYGRWNPDIGRVEPVELSTPAPGGLLPDG